MPYGLAVNYHHTPSTLVDSMRLQLAAFRERFVAIDRNGLARLQAGTWPHHRPGIMIHFDDGFLDHATVAAPLIEKYGFRGWFSIITDRVDAASRGPDTTEPPADRSMTWNHARELRRRGHEICSHTCGHTRMRSTLTDAQIEHEILDSYARIGSELGEPPAGFCWPGGEDDAYDARAMKLVMGRYDRAFPSFTRPIRPGDSPFEIARSNIEGTWDLDLVRLSVGRIWERKHRARADAYSRNVRATAERL